MSHAVEIGLLVKDLGALKAACTALGGTFHENQSTFEYYAGSKERCAHAISFPGTRYEVGMVKRGDGRGYELLCDFWSTGGLSQRIGPEGRRLKDEYSLAITKKTYAEKGYLLTVIRRENGDIIVTAEN